MTSRRFGRVAVGLLVALGGALWTLASTTESLADHVVGHAAAASSALADLTAIDRLLTKAIQEVGTGRSVVHRIDQIKRDKLDLVGSEFTQPVDGVKGSDWFRLLDCVDAELQLAKVTDEGHAFGGPGEGGQRVKTFLASAQRCKQRLETQLRRAGRVSSSALADLTEIDRLLTKAIQEVGTGRSAVHRIDQIKRDKLGLVGSEFTQPVDGVKGSDWFRLLDCVDAELQLAKVTDEGHAFGGPGEGGQRVKTFLAGAQRCKQRLETQLRKASSSTPLPAPTLKPIHAVFSSAPAGQSCGPPYCTTVYTENATGEGLIYTWSISIPADPNCAKGFQPNKPNPNQATWYHADESEGGYCNHGGTTYDASGSGHPGTVTVTVTNTDWSCQAVFYGTQGPQAQPTWDGPSPEACQQKNKP